jgi:hypothetical protein
VWHRPEDLSEAVDTLLADTDLDKGMDGMRARIRARDGLTRGAVIIERVGLEHRRSGEG